MRHISPLDYDNPYDYYDACFDREDEFSGRDDFDDVDCVEADFIEIELERRGLV
jgi:hypothetical protein